MENEQSNALMAVDALPRSLEEIKKYAYVFAKSGMFPDIKSLSQGMVKIIAGREIGLSPFASVRGINIINGKPELSANVIASLIKSSGRYDYRVGEWTDKGCEIAFYQIEEGKKANKDSREEIGKSKFDEADATRAGLINKDPWRKHPRSMYFARAMSIGARTFCPDIYNGNSVYVEGEISGDEPTSVHVIESGQVHDDVKEEVPNAHIEEPETNDAGSPPAAEQTTATNKPAADTPATEEANQTVDAPAGDEPQEVPIEEPAQEESADSATLIGEDGEPFVASEQFKADVMEKIEEFNLNEFQKIRLLMKSTNKTTLPDNDLDWMKLDAYCDAMAEDSKLMEDVLQTAKKAKAATK